ncbi:MAG: BCCT family transporter [Bacillota bacterium]|jgi:BCCT family betaine/carnitine transporter
MDRLKKQNDRVEVSKSVFLISVLCCLVFYVPLIIFQEAAQGVVDRLMHDLTFGLDWFFEGVCFICLVFTLWLIVGRFGSVKLGTEDDAPEFKTFTWIAMFFCAGIGAGAMYWACVEPLYYLDAPPFGLEPFSAAAREWSMSYVYFHWGFTPWAIFAVPAIAFAYCYYNRQQFHFKASYACSGVLGKRAYGRIGTAIDVLVVVGMIGGFATSLGFVFPMISGLISQYLHIEDSLLLQFMIGGFFTLIYTWSCVRGLYSGIAKLSNFNMAMFMLFIAFIFVVGPTGWILSNFCDSFGNMLQNYLRMSFYTDSIAQSGFPQNWTVFYWAWWASWAIYIGLFMARISKGRTIRAFLANMIFAAGGGTILIFAVIGSYGQHVYFNLGIDLVSILNNQGGPVAIYEMISTLPAAKVVIPLFVLLLMVAQATGIDSAAYTLANVTSEEVGYAAEPKLWLRVFWALFIFFATMSLLVVGGMNVVKLSSVLTSVPILILLILFMISVTRWLLRDFGGKRIQCISADRIDVHKSEHEGFAGETD